MLFYKLKIKSSESYYRKPTLLLTLAWKKTLVFLSLQNISYQIICPFGLFNINTAIALRSKSELTSIAIIKFAINRLCS